MKVRFDDGQEFWVDGDTLPDNMTIAQLKAVLLPWPIYEARQQLVNAQADLAATPEPSAEDLQAWAVENHPTMYRRRLLLLAVEQAQAALDAAQGVSA